MKEVSQDDTCSAAALRNLLSDNLSERKFKAAESCAEAAREAAKAVTGWRIEGTLREFPKFPPVNLWFRYPVHTVDDSGVLSDLSADGGASNWKKAQRGRKEKAELNRRSQEQEFADAVANCCAGEPPTVKDLAEWYAETGKEVSERTIKRRAEKFGFFLDRNTGKIVKKDSTARTAL